MVRDLSVTERELEQALMRTTASLIRKVLVRSRGGLKQGMALKQVKGPGKNAYKAKKVDAKA